MNIFTSGIVWDPREPLPVEYAHLESPFHYSRTPIDGVDNDKVIEVNDRSGQRSQRYVVARNPHIAPPGHNFAMQVSPRGAAEKPQVETMRLLPENIIQQQNRNVLPPVSVSIDAKIIQDIARVTVRQLFWNDADVPIVRGSYCFPLPHGCTVTSFSCRIGRDPILKAEVRPKDEAKQAFETAVEEHQMAALLDQNTSEIFTASLGNIPPDTRLKVEFTYVILLKHRFADEKNTITFVVPCSIARRYGNPPADMGNLDLWGSPRQSKIRVEIMEPDKISQIKSDTHKITIERALEGFRASHWDSLATENPNVGLETAVVEIDDDVEVLNGDFVLSVQTESYGKKDLPRAYLEIHPTLEKQSAMMVTIPPRFLIPEDGVQQSGEILFLADRSGSMEDKMSALKSAMDFFLKGLPLGSTFNIWSFGSQHQSLWHKSVPYSAESLWVAQRHVETDFKADLGGTELLAALHAIVQARDTSRPCDIIILTDGEVWRLEETLDLVMSTKITSKGAVRFFSLGIGAQVSHALVEGIATRGGGYSEVIPKASQGGWEDRVVAMLTAALTEHIKSIDIDIDVDSDISSSFQSPASCKDLNPFQGSRLYYLFDEDLSARQVKTITINSSVPGRKRDSNIIPLIEIPTKDSVIHSLSAKAVLDDFEIGQGISESITNPAITYLPTLPPASSPDISTQKLLNQQAQNLACKFSLTSRWTSFFLRKGNDHLVGGEYTEHTLIGIRNKKVARDSRLLKSRGIVPCTSGGVKFGNAKFGNAHRRLDSSGAGCAGANMYHGHDGGSWADEISLERRRDTLLTPRVAGLFDPPDVSDEALGYTQDLEARGFGMRTTQESGEFRLDPEVPAEMYRNRSPLRLRSEGDSLDYLAQKYVSGESTERERREDETQKEFAKKLLSCQAFDGGVDRNMRDLLSKDFDSAVKEIATHLIPKVGMRSWLSKKVWVRMSYTVIAVVLLERDCQSCRDLWGLISMKALQFIRSRLPVPSDLDGLMSFARERLEGKKIPLFEERAVSTSLDSEPESEDFEGPADRRVVHTAPHD